MSGGKQVPGQQVPGQQEARGGNQPDWKKVVPGEPLPELPEAEYPEPESSDDRPLRPEDEMKGQA